MVNIRTEAEIDLMRIACSLTAQSMKAVSEEIKPGVNTQELADIAQSYIESHGGVAAFLDYNGFPGAICVSVNDEVVHGIPDKNQKLKDGDLVKVDIGTYIEGFYGDMARTFAVGDISEKDARLMEITKESFFQGMQKAVSGNSVGDIGHAIQSYVESKGCSVVRDLVGHGIGRHLHEEPQVPNFGQPGKGAVLKSGMVLAVEPMVNAGRWNVKTLSDDWTVVTSDGKQSSHYENTCLIQDGSPEILTLMIGE